MRRKKGKNRKIQKKTKKRKKSPKSSKTCQKRSMMNSISIGRNLKKKSPMKIHRSPKRSKK